MGERASIERLFKRLLKSEVVRFPRQRERMSAPRDGGVYVIYSPSGAVLHVGRTPSGKGGLAQRLKNHLHNSSSFTRTFLKGKGSRLRRSYGFRVLVVKDTRERALLEHLAIGRLCPKHLGLSKERGAD